MDTHGLYPAFFAWLSENGLDAYALSTNQLLIYLEKFCCENKDNIEANTADIDEVHEVLAGKVDKYTEGMTPEAIRAYIAHNAGGTITEAVPLSSDDFELIGGEIQLKNPDVKYYQHFVTHNGGQHAFSWIDTTPNPYPICVSVAMTIKPGAQMYSNGAAGIFSAVSYDSGTDRYTFTDASGLVTAFIDKTAEVTDTVTEI